ncbi:uncharacterized protein CEXT_609301 [Caerostris extrusa]|uniref:Chitin-binding type-2 domain-containing protein n=1 Tax=Caerostris extrusa TaxID=172846 RepID=A0AAV4Y9D4_CAEEX|nr:uncharacterized protein CEXT_609301 [Caerostris extrusa]
MKFLIFVFAVLGASTAFECPDGSSAFYHVDESTGCQVYHFCDKSGMLTFTCPSGQAFDTSTKICVEATSVQCGDSTLLRKKRSEVTDSVREVAPTVYDKFEADYSLIYESVKDVSPLYNQGIAPQLQKAYDYSKKLFYRFFLRLQQSWKASNATHFNVYSVEDIISDVKNDLGPVLQMGKYLSSRMMRSRPKRETENPKPSPEMDRLREQHFRQYLARKIIQLPIQEYFSREKRSVVTVHSISKAGLKEQALKAKSVLMTFLEGAVRDVAPTVYDKFEAEYSSILEPIKDDVLPLFRKQLAPQLKKACDYSKKLFGRFFERFYKSWEASNATHLNIYSVEDIISDVKNDMKPILQMGKYISSKMMHSRPKREVPEFVQEIARPLASSFVSDALNLVVGEEESFMGKIILPTVFDMIQDPETRFDCIDYSGL